MAVSYAGFSADGGGWQPAPSDRVSPGLLTMVLCVLQPGGTAMQRCGHSMRVHTVAFTVYVYATIGLPFSPGSISSHFGPGCRYAASLWPEQQQAVAAELRAAGIFGPAAVVEVAANAEEAEGQVGCATRLVCRVSCVAARTHECHAPSSTLRSATLATRMVQQRCDLLLCAATKLTCCVLAAAYRTGRAMQSGPRRPPLRLDAQHCPGPEELAKLPRLNAFINEVGWWAASCVFLLVVLENTREGKNTHGNL